MKSKTAWAELHPRRFFLETWKELDRERVDRTDQPGFDYKPLIVLCSGAVFLTLMEYFGNAAFYAKVLSHLGLPGWPEDAYDWLQQLTAAASTGGADDRLRLDRARAFAKFHKLTAYVWWSGWRVPCYFILPAMIVRFGFRENLRSYGLAGRGLGEHAWIYVLFYFLVLLAVVAVSFLGEFSSYYPFYKLATRSWFDFAAWELLYAAQFFSLEFFFRGYWLHACKRSMGSHAIFAMVVPYCMIHFGKPWLEALAAIAAGVVLGTLALKTRSIWSGFALHVSVAISMDLAAILQTSNLPNQWWPG